MFALNLPLDVETLSVNDENVNEISIKLFEY